MTNSLFNLDHDPSVQAVPQLLVSVRSVYEAEQALAGGADIIDIKEPANGPLGPANIETIQEIAEFVAKHSAEVPLTAALGELNYPRSERTAQPATDLTNQLSVLTQLPNLVGLKIGLAGNLEQPWQKGLAVLKRQIDTQNKQQVELIAVAYADALKAKAPNPEQVFAAANRLGFRGFVIDTYEKQPSQDNPTDLFQQMNQEQLIELFEVVRLMEIIGTVAGSLTRDRLDAALQVKPHIIGVRGAVCDKGRQGEVSAKKVSEFAAEISRLAKS